MKNVFVHVSSYCDHYWQFDSTTPTAAVKKSFTGSVFAERSCTQQAGFLHRRGGWCVLLSVLMDSGNVKAEGGICPVLF